MMERNRSHSLRRARPGDASRATQAGRRKPGDASRAPAVSGCQDELSGSKTVRRRSSPGVPYFVPTMQRATPGILTLPSCS
jgi:hypothetical protein